MRMRVLEVLPTLKRAGAEQVVVSLARELDARRFETAVAALYDASAGDFETELRERGIRVWRLGKRRGLDLRMVPRLARVFREFRPAVIHTHSYVLRYTLPANTLARTRAALVHTVHNLGPKEVDWAGRLIHRVAFRRRVAAVAVGGEVARSFRALYGRDPAATILNGIDPARYSLPCARERWRQDNGFREDDLLVVSVARLDTQKNPVGMVEAFAQALGAQPRCHLLMAGDGNLAAAARERAAQSDAAGRVHFLGVRSDVAEILSTADIFALASHWEGMPMAVMEAMAAGLPVVATAAGGVPELVEHGRSGLLCAPGDMDALAAALAAVARSPQHRRELGEAARKAARRFSAAAMAAAYARLFRRLTGGRR